MGDKLGGASNGAASVLDAPPRPRRMKVRKGRRAQHVFLTISGHSLAAMHKMETQMGNIYGDIVATETIFHRLHDVKSLHL